MEMDEENEVGNENEGINPDDPTNENADIANGNGAGTGAGAGDSHARSRTLKDLRRDRDRETKERQRRAKEKAKIDLLLAPARGHPAAVYYLPAILLPSQRRFMEKRRE